MLRGSRDAVRKDQVLVGLGAHLVHLLRAAVLSIIDALGVRTAQALAHFSRTAILSDVSVLRVTALLAVVACRILRLLE